MSHDVNQAILASKKGRPYIQFLGVGRNDHVTHLNKVLENATNTIGGTSSTVPSMLHLDIKQRYVSIGAYSDID